MLRYVKTICISAENVLSLYSEEERTRRYRVFSSFFMRKWPQKRVFLQSMQKNLYAEAEIFSLRADFRLAKLVNELTIQIVEKLKDIYFKTAFFTISRFYSGRSVRSSYPAAMQCGQALSLFSISTMLARKIVLGYPQNPLKFSGIL